MEPPAPASTPRAAGDMSSSSVLPVIDLADPDAGATAAHLRAACTEWGFFYLTGHGIDPALMAAVLTQCRAFFALPLAQKMALRGGGDGGGGDPSRGYSPYQSEMLNPQEQRQPCTQEGFRLKLTTGHGAAADAAARAAHPWPDPGALPAFRATLEEYHGALQAVAYRVTQLLLASLGLDQDYLHDAFHPCSATTRLLHYPPVVSKPEEGILGCGSHTDWGCLTLLLSDDEDGLEVQRRADGAWVPTPSRPRQQQEPSHADADSHSSSNSCSSSRPLLCNIGDMLQRWSGDALRSTPHRVVNRLGRDRFSIPFFYAPRPDAVVECLPPFREEGGRGKYPPVVVSEYIAMKYRGITEAAKQGGGPT